jgi:pimeloyl-ACP methyl ester carboxylesterase
MTTNQVIVNTGYVMTEGDEIYYEVRGQGTPLLMISGGGGDTGCYSLVADILSDEYQVITYDRRGNSRSTRNEPQNFEISQQSRDAVAVLHANGHESAIVFGNSGGAVIALEMAKIQPQAIKAVIVHEPPVLGVLPDRKKWFRFFAGIYRLAFTFGVGVAMIRFGLSLKIPMKPNPEISKDFGKRMSKNNDFFMKHEMLPFTKYMPDVETIKKNGVQIFMAAGKITLDAEKYYGITAPILAESFGCEMVTFPGHHISYLDRPKEWASTLRNILQTI